MDPEYFVDPTILKSPSECSSNLALLDGEQAWTSTFNLKSFVMNSVQVGKAAIYLKDSGLCKQLHLAFEYIRDSEYTQKDPAG